MCMHILIYTDVVKENCTDQNLQSSSTMMTVASLGAPTVTPLGSDELIASIKFSSISNIISSVIGTSNEAIVIPAGNVTVYGPEV